MVSAMVLSIPTLVLPLLLAPPVQCEPGRLGHPAEQARAIAAFENAVEEYVALHRRLERAWPPLSFFADPEQAEMAAEALRTALRDARPMAGRGNLFAPAVADVLRCRIARAVLEGEGYAAWPPRGAEDIDRWRPQVGQPIPWGVLGMRWPLITALPTLPSELAYRFIGGDLVVVDVHANLVVDVLERALPAAASPFEDVFPFPPGAEDFEEEPLLPWGTEDFEGCSPEW